jgi:hypothetical protein
MKRRENEAGRTPSVPSHARPSRSLVVALLLMAGIEPNPGPPKSGGGSVGSACSGCQASRALPRQCRASPQAPPKKRRSQLAALLMGEKPGHTTGVRI